jgi:hypothetical protein
LAALAGRNISHSSSYYAHAHSLPRQHSSSSSSTSSHDDYSYSHNDYSYSSYYYSSYYYSSYYYYYSSSYYYYSSSYYYYSSELSITTISSNTPDPPAILSRHYLRQKHITLTHRRRPTATFHLPHPVNYIFIE